MSAGFSTPKRGAAAKTVVNPLRSPDSGLLCGYGQLSFSDASECTMLRRDLQKRLSQDSQSQSWSSPGLSSPLASLTLQSPVKTEKVPPRRKTAGVGLELCDQKPEDGILLCCSSQQSILKCNS